MDFITLFLFLSQNYCDMKDIKLEIGISYTHTMGMLGHHTSPNDLSVKIINNTHHTLHIREVSLFTKCLFFKTYKLTRKLDTKINNKYEYTFKISGPRILGICGNKSKFYLKIITDKGVIISDPILTSLLK